jgi:ATP-dependent RNA helicase SUPV3L1/SUV3
VTPEHDPGDVGAVPDPASDAPSQATAETTEPTENLTDASFALQEPEVAAALAVSEAEVAPDTPLAPDPNQLGTDAAEAAATDAAPAEAGPMQDALIEVWRPGGRSSEERRPRHRPRPRQNRPAQAPAATGEGAPAVAAADGLAAEGAAEGAASTETGAPEEGRRRHRRHRRGPVESAAAPGDKPAEQETREPRRVSRPERKDRPDREERHARGESRGPRRNDRGRDGNRPAQKWSSANERRGEPDPNSPFAKLAALKAQLESGKD